MSPGNRNSGRKDSNPANKRVLHKLGDALAEQKAKEKAQNTGARIIRKLHQKRGK